MRRESVFKRHFLPGFVFQSFVIAGGSRPCSSQPVIAVVLLIVGALVASFGLVNLTAKGSSISTAGTEVSVECS